MALKEKKSKQLYLKYRFSQTIIRLREEKGLTIEELSNASYIPINLLYNLELGNYED